MHLDHPEVDHRDGREEPRREGDGEDAQHHQAWPARRLKISAGLLDQAGTFLLVFHLTSPMDGLQTSAPIPASLETVLMLRAVPALASGIFSLELAMPSP